MLSSASLHGTLRIKMFSSATVILGTLRGNTVDADQMTQMCQLVYFLTLKALITTAADDILSCVRVFQTK